MDPQVIPARVRQAQAAAALAPAAMLGGLQVFHGRPWLRDQILSQVVREYLVPLPQVRYLLANLRVTASENERAAARMCWSQSSHGRDGRFHASRIFHS